MPYYEYKGKIDRVLVNINNNYDYIAIYFKIDKKDIIVRNNFRYITCITYNDETPSAKLCSLCDINNDYYLRISVPLNDNSSNGNNFLNIAQSLKPGVNLEVVFKSEGNTDSDNTAALITFTNDADAF